MGLGWGEAVPVDTHVWQIAQRDYGIGKGFKGKTLTKALYDAVGDHWRGLFGPQAGWAQSVLFTTNLKSFNEQAASKKLAVVSPTEQTTAKVEKVTMVKVEEANGIAVTGSGVPTKKRKAPSRTSQVKEEHITEEKTELEVTTTAVRRSKRIKRS